MSAIWTANYRAGFENRSSTGRLKSWICHDVVLDWKEPLGLEGAQAAAGVFNLTDAGPTVDTANPNSVGGPASADWGRAFFLTFNKRFGEDRRIGRPISADGHAMRGLRGRMAS